MRNCHKHGQKLKDCGFRITIAREVIWDMFLKTNEHLSAEDIYMTVHETNPEIGLTTVYRTLDLLEQNGIVCKFEFGHGRAKYELSEKFSNKSHHHHLICKKCKKIIDYTDFIEDEKDFISKTEEGLARKYGFKIDTHVINFYGFCPECDSQ